MNKVCKKCKRVLPENYKSKYCERCKNIGVDNFKKVGTAILGVGVVGLSIITRGKINLKK